MKRTVWTVVRAVVGLVVLFFLLYTVSNWWRDYRSAGSSGTGATTTETVSPAAEGSTVVVLVDGLNLRAEPASDAESIRGLNKDEKLVLLKVDGKWYQVETAEGDQGWISSSPSYTSVENP